MATLELPSNFDRRLLMCLPALRMEWERTTWRVKERPFRRALVVLLVTSLLGSGGCGGDSGSERMTLQQVPGTTDDTERVQLQASPTPITAKPEFIGHTGPVTGVAFFPDNIHVVSGSHDMTLRIWDRRYSNEVRRFTGHVGEVTSVAISPDGKQLASGAADTTVRLWDAETGREIRQMRGHSDHVTYVAFSSDGSRVLSAALDQTLRVWQTDSGKQLHRLDLPADHDPLVCVAFNADGSRAFTAGNTDDDAWQEWDVATGAELNRVRNNQGGIAAMAIVPDGTRLLTAGKNESFYCWDLATRKVATRFNGSPRPIDTITVSADGRFAATGGSGNRVRMWEIEHGVFLKEYRGHAAEVQSVAFSLNHTHLVSASSDNTVRLWTAASRLIVDSRLKSAAAAAMSSYDYYLRDGQEALRNYSTQEPLSPEEYQPDPAIVQAVRRRIQESASSATPTQGPAAAFRDLWTSFMSDLLVDSYETHGKHDPGWDDDVVQFLREVAKFDTHAPDATPRAALKLQLQLLRDSGCDDPLILLYQVVFELDELQDHLVVPSITAALAGFQQSTYPVRLAYRARLYVGGFFATKPVVTQLSKSPMPSALEMFASAVEESCASPIAMRTIAVELKEIVTPYLSFRPESRTELYDRLAAQPNVDPWLTNLLIGRYHLGLGRRGIELGDRREQDESGRAIHELHFARAAVLLSKAWQLHPEWPEAAASLIVACEGGASIAGESPQFWFEQAVGAEFDHPDAYDAILAVHTLPGRENYPAVLRFGRECLETGRFDTSVPRVFETAVELVADGAGERADVLQKSSVLAGLENLYVGYRDVTTDRYQQSILDSRQVAAMLLSDRPDEARRRVAELHDRFNAAEIAWFGSSPRNYLTRLGLPNRDDAFGSELDGEVPEVTAKFTFEPGTDWARHVAFSPDGRFGASSHDDNALRIWDLATGRLVSTSANDAIAGLSFMRFLPDGSGLIAAGRGAGVGRWRLSDGARGSTFEAVTGNTTALAVSGDGGTIAAASDAGLWLLDGASGAVRFHGPNVRASRLAVRDDGHADAILKVAFYSSPGGEHLLTASRDKTIRDWDLATGRTTRRLVGHGSAVRDVAIAEGGRRAVSTGFNEAVCLWDLESGSLLRSFPGFAQFVLAPSGDRMLCVDRRFHTLDLVDTASGQVTARLAGHQHEVRGAAISPDGTTALSASRDGTVRVWSLPASTEPLERYMPYDPSAIAAAEINGVVRIGEIEMTRNRPILKPDDRFVPWRDWTLSLDYRRMGKATTGQIVYWGMGIGRSPVLSLRFDAGQLLVDVAGSAGSPPSSIQTTVGSPGGGVWRSVAVRYRAARQRIELFVDGQLAGQDDCSAPLRYDYRPQFIIGDTPLHRDPFTGKVRGLWLSN